MLTIQVDAMAVAPWPFAVLRHTAANLGPRPDWRLIAGDAGPNRRVDWGIARMASNGFKDIPPPWRDTAVMWTTQGAWDHIYLPLFGESIRDAYPWLEQKVNKPLAEWRVGRRFLDNDCDVYLDFQIGINTPTGATASSVSGPHVDNPVELIGGILYMREEGDDAGGDIRVWAVDSPRFTGKADLHPECAGGPIVRVPYSRDNGFLFVNTPRSVHDVTVRKPTERPRLLVSICAEMPFPLFEVPR